MEAWKRLTGLEHFWAGGNGGLRTAREPNAPEIEEYTSNHQVLVDTLNHSGPNIMIQGTFLNERVVGSPGGELEGWAPRILVLSRSVGLTSVTAGPLAPPTHLKTSTYPTLNESPDHN